MKFENIFCKVWIFLLDGLLHDYWHSLFRLVVFLAGVPERGRKTSLHATIYISHFLLI